MWVDNDSGQDSGCWWQKLSLGELSWNQDLSSSRTSGGWGRMTLGADHSQETLYQWPLGHPHISQAQLWDQRFLVPKQKSDPWFHICLSNPSQGMAGLGVWVWLPVWQFPPGPQASKNTFWKKRVSEQAEKSKWPIQQCFLNVKSHHEIYLNCTHVYKVTEAFKTVSASTTRTHTPVFVFNLILGYRVPSKSCAVLSLNKKCKCYKPTKHRLSIYLTQDSFYT